MKETTIKIEQRVVTLVFDCPYCGKKIKENIFVENVAQTLKRPRYCIENGKPFMLKENN